VESLSVFGRYTRTNNDVEGWHFRLNRKARKSQLPFYLLIKLLHDEAIQVDITCQLVSENKLSRRERQKYRKEQVAIFSVWDKHINGLLSPFKLLKACSSDFRVGPK